MYSLAVSDHVMIAHSFVGEIFGPAQQLHGATYAVEIDVRRAELDGNGLVCDIGLARELLDSRSSPLDYRNLDELAAFRGRNTTTEFLAGEIFRRLKARIAAGALGPGTAGALQACACGCANRRSPGPRSRDRWREVLGAAGARRDRPAHRRLSLCAPPGRRAARAAASTSSCASSRGAFPMPTTAARAACAAALAALPDGAVAVIDGLALAGFAALPAARGARGCACSRSSIIRSPTRPG